MIENIVDYINFCNKTYNHHLMLSAIPTDDVSIHSAASKLSVVLAKDLKTDETYTFSFDHPDCLFRPDLEDFSVYLPLNRFVWCFDKKSACHVLNAPTFLDIDLFTHLNENWILDRNVYETAAHKLIKRNNSQQRNINNIIPLLKHEEMFERMCNEIRMRIKFPETIVDDGFRRENNVTLETLAELEKVGIHVDPTCFRNHFPNAEIHDGDMVYSQYNVYTATGRPSNRFDGVNYAALNKSDGSRKCFTSRFGDNGKMVLVDFSAFHPRIISYLIKFPLGIDVDIYTYLGELYFNRKITEYDMDEIKALTMRQFYGGVEEKYQHIKYLSHARAFIEKYWHDFKKDGFIKTPVFKRIITDKHLLEPNPPKVLNYILQATETEIATMILRDVQWFLKNHKTKAVLYTYDSILFDFYKPEQEGIFQPLLNIMKMVDKFPIKVYEGNTYDDVVQISV